MARKEEEITTHPSFGTICVTRGFSGKDRSMFMSAIKHGTTLRLEIQEAERIWNGGEVRCHGRKRKFAIEMTELQFAQLFSGIGRGEGTPCTIIFDHNGPVESCPDDTTARDVESNIDDVVTGSVKEASDLVKYLQGLADQPRVKKAELKEALSRARKVHMGLKDSLPYYLKRAQEILEGTIGDAQAQIMGFLQTRAKQLGINPHSINPFKSLRGKKDDND